MVPSGQTTGARGWRGKATALLVAAAIAHLSAGIAWSETERLAVTTWDTWSVGTVTQRPDPRGCLLAATGTVANLLQLQHGQAEAVTYQDVWLHYDHLVPGFARDPWAYPQPWGLQPLAERLGGLEAVAVRTYDGDDMDAWLEQGLYPIVYLGGSMTTPAHAVVVLAQDAYVVHYFDPWDGQRTAPRDAFYGVLGAWATLLWSPYAALEVTDDEQGPGLDHEPVEAVAELERVPAPAAELLAR